MLKSNRMKSIAEIPLVSKAVIEHLFSNHEYCDKVSYGPKRELETFVFKRIILSVR